MRIPRRAAVLLSALAVTGSVAGCGGDDAGDIGPGIDEPGVQDATLPPGQGEPDVEPSP